MVLESVLNPFTAAKRPWELLIAGIIYGSAALFLSIWIFEEYASLVMVFLAVLASLPLFYKTLKSEEAKDLIINSESRLLKEHGKAIMLLVLLFLGMTIAFSFWYVALPAETSNSVFKIQTQTIASLNQQVTASIAKFNLLNRIFLNNIKVLIFCILFSFIYGSGAIFILTWNASVISTAIGNYIRVNLSSYSTAAGFSKFGSYLHVISIGLLKYSIHGIPEILAYFVAGLAGGIVSVAVIRESFGTKTFTKALLDASDLIIIAVLITFIAAILEVWVTPAIF